MPSFLIRGLARYFAASTMESRARSQSSYTPSPDSPSNDSKKLSSGDLASWQTQMRWLIPFVQATGNQVVIENPKSHEQIIIDKNTKELPELTLEWMQKYDRQELAEWIDNEHKKQQQEESERQKKLESRRIEEARGRVRFGNSYTLGDKGTNDLGKKSKNSNNSNYLIPILCICVFILALIGLWVYNSPAFEQERWEKEYQKSLEVSYSLNINQDENDSIINTQLKTLVDSTLSQHLQFKLDSCNITSSVKYGDTLKDISGTGFSKLYKEIFDVTGSYIVSQNILSCKSLEVTHRHVGCVFEMYDTITKQVDSLTFSQQLDEYNKRQDELWQEHKDLVGNAYANQTKVHFGISREEYNRLGEDFQRNFYEGLVGYGAYELSEPRFDRKGIFSGFEIMEIHDKTFSYYNVQNNAELVRKRKHGFGANETFWWVYVCELYNMEIMSRYDKFDRRTKNSLKCYWNEYIRMYN